MKERIILAEGQPWFSYNKHKTFPDRIGQKPATGILRPFTAISTIFRQFRPISPRNPAHWTVPFCKPYNEDDLITPGKRWRLVLEEI